MRKGIWEMLGEFLREAAVLVLVFGLLDRYLFKRNEVEPVWEGDVYTFALSGHPTARVCFAWSAPVGDTHNRRFFAVLKLGPVQSARDAVRASIVQAYREETEGKM